MPGQKLPMRQVREVLRLRHVCGHSGHLIATAVSVSRYTVAEYLRCAAMVGITWPVPPELDDARWSAGCLGRERRNGARNLVGAAPLRPGGRRQGAAADGPVLCAVGLGRQGPPHPGSGRNQAGDAVGRPDGSRRARQARRASPGPRLAPIPSAKSRSEAGSSGRPARHVRHPRHPLADSDSFLADRSLPAPPSRAHARHPDRSAAPRPSASSPSATASRQGSPSKAGACKAWPRTWLRRSLPGGETPCRLGCSTALTATPDS